MAALLVLLAAGGAAAQPAPGPVAAFAVLLGLAASRRCRRTARAVAGWVALLALAPAVQAGEIEIDFQSFGSYTTESFGACRVFVVPTDSGALLSLGPGGAGVEGALGSIGDALDGGESLLFSFPTSFPTDGDAGAVGIWYQVVAGGNQNAMGGLADAFVEAFDSASLSLGVRAVTGVTTIDVSALYGGVPIRSLRLTAAGDSQQIGRLGFRPAPSSATLLQLRGFGAVQTPQFEICDVTITASADVVLSSTGLGIAGASSPTLLDGFEWVRFDFDRPQHTVVYETEAVADLNANGTAADAFIEGYGANGASLGLVSVSGDEQHVVSEHFAGVPLSGFRVVANSDAQRLLVVSHVPEPGAPALGSAAGMALAALALAMRRSRRVSAGEAAGQARDRAGRRARVAFVGGPARRTSFGWSGKKSR